MEIIKRQEAVSEIKRTAKSVGMTFTRANTKHNGVSLWQLSDKESGRVIIDNYDVWNAYADCMSGYIESLAEG